MKFLSKLQPFVENIVIGLLFVGVGLYIMRSFNESSFGLVGLAAIIWGGFKILIGLFIYGVALWALFFRPESFTDLKIKKAIDRALKKIENDVRLTNMRIAQDMLHAEIMKHPNNLAVKFALGKVYMNDHDLARAGRCLYLKSHPNKKERECIRAFEISVGGNAFQILRRISKPSKIDKDFVTGSKSKIKSLLTQIKSETEKRSWIVREYEYHLEEVDIPFYKKLWKDERDIIIHAIVLIVLFSLAKALA